MSSTLVDSLKLAMNTSTIYGGFFLFTIGILGNMLNIVIFTSLKTFRETSAAFYMNATSAVNIFHLLVSLLSRILITGYNIDRTQSSDFLCKGRRFTSTATMLIVSIYKSLAVIDHYLSLTNRWRHLCNLNVASRLVIALFIFWCLHGISSWILEGVHPVASSHLTSCFLIDPVFSAYMNRFVLAVLLGFLPLMMRITFALLAFVNIRRLQTHRIPIVRLRRDKQLSTMVLVEVLVDIILVLPYSIFFYGNFAISFYIYYCVSSRFRRQFVYVLFEVHLKRCRNRRNNNQITPQSVEMNEIPEIKLTLST